MAYIDPGGAEQGESPPIRTGKPPADINAKGAYVFLDFVFEDGLFFVSIKNYSQVKPALDVRVTFDRELMGLGGRKPMHAMLFFRGISFLAPGKEISTYLDRSSDFLRREGPAEFTTTIAYRDLSNRRYRVTVKHNLRIYREIGYVRRLMPDDAGGRGGDAGDETRTDGR